MAEKLTEARATAATVLEGRAEQTHWDASCPGLGLRVRSSGSKSWVFFFRPAGAGRSVPSKRVSLGKFPAVSLAAAREAGRKLAGQVASGRDPAVERRETKRRERATLEAALSSYERNLEARKVVNKQAIMSTLRRGLASLMSRDIAELTRADFVDKIDAVFDSGRKGAAADLRKHCRSLCEWAVSSGIAPYNVLAGLRMPKMTRAQRMEAEETGRALSEEEICKLWAAAGQLGSLGGLIRLGLLTGFRRNELSGLEWGDVLSDRIILPGGERTKTGAAHAVPLTPLMQVVLSAYPRGYGASDKSKVPVKGKAAKAKLKGGNDLIFRSSKTDGPISGWNRLVPRAAEISGVEFRLHDLRRTTRTLLSQLGVAEDIAELCIGHRRADLVARYNRDDAWPQRVEAFNQLDEKLAKIIGHQAGNVVALSAKREVAR
jgi:integrase